MQNASRREFIVRGGALVGAVCLAGPGAALAGPRGAVALAEERRATLAALAETVVTEAPYRLPAGAGEQAAAEFAARYAAWDDRERARADRVLDELERADGRSFRRTDRARRAEVLREHATPRSALPTGQERKRLDLAQDAFALLGTVLGADTDLDHSPTTI